MYFVSTTEEMEAIGPSPPASPGPGVEEEQSTAEKAVVDLDQLEDPAPPAKKSVTHTQETKFRREFPYFTTLKTCLTELGKNKVKTEHGNVNNCLFYSYQVATGAIRQKDQKTP